MILNLFPLRCRFLFTIFLFNSGRNPLEQCLYKCRPFFQQLILVRIDHPRHFLNTCLRDLIQRFSFNIIDEIIVSQALKCIVPVKAGKVFIHQMYSTLDNLFHNLTYLAHFLELFKMCHVQCLQFFNGLAVRFFDWIHYHLCFFHIDFN